jgi:DNA invertase Pin-like site-specific DNA recombinase
MDIKKLLKIYGTASEIARAFGVSRQAVAKWVAAGEIPLLRQYQAEVLLRGRKR